MTSIMKISYSCAKSLLLPFILHFSKHKGILLSVCVFVQWEMLSITYVATFSLFVSSDWSMSTAASSASSSSICSSTSFTGSSTKCPTNVYLS